MAIYEQEEQNKQPVYQPGPTPSVAVPSPVAAFQSAPSVASGVGLAARDAVGGMASGMARTQFQAPLQAAQGLAAGAQAVAQPIYEGVRAFVTGKAAQAPPSVAAPSVAAQPEPVWRQPAPGFDANGQRAAPYTGVTPPGQPSVNQPLVGTATAIPMPMPVAYGTYDTPQPEQQAVPLPGYAPQQFPSVVQPPQPVTSVPGSGGRGARSTLGKAFGVAAGLSVAKGENAMAQRGFKNDLKALDANLSVAKVGGELARTNADIAKSGADVAKTKEETKRLETERKNQEEVQSLRSQIVAEQDPKKRAALERKLQAITGKQASKVQIVVQEGVDANGMPTKTPMAITVNDDGTYNTQVIKPAQVPAAQNPQAVAIRDNPKLSREEKVEQLQALGY